MFSKQEIIFLVLGLVVLGVFLLVPNPAVKLWTCELYMGAGAVLVGAGGWKEYRAAKNEGNPRAGVLLAGRLIIVAFLCANMLLLGWKASSGGLV